MRVIPSRPPETATGSERDVFSLLQQLSWGDEAVALCSLNLAKHESQRWGEIDFVVVNSGGLLALEVKGGTVTCTESVWRCEDAWGRVIEKAISPIAQAQRGYSSVLNKYLRPKLGQELVARAPTGFCAILGRTTRQQARHLIGGTEMPPELVATKEDCENAESLRRFLLGALSYWKAASKRQITRWTSAEVTVIVSELRPWFDRVPPLSIALCRTREEQCALTEDQYRFIDYVERARRIVCSGAAGTGKTFLAVECLRREASFNPILVTGTDSLADHLRGENVPDSTRIISFSELEKAIDRHERRYSTLIVDEGQQLTNEHSIRLLGRIVDRKLEAARWRWFEDSNHQVTAQSAFEGKALKRLTHMADLSCQLKENCRNTPEIIKAVEFATGLPIGSTKVKGGGPEVLYGQSRTPQGLCAEAGLQIREWLQDEEVQPRDIVILTANCTGRSSVAAIATEAGFPVANWCAGWARDPRNSRKLGACSIEQFRGLEAPFVVLCDLDGEMGALERALYLGMTRANFALFVCCDWETRQRLVQERINSQAMATAQGATTSSVGH